MKTITIPKSFGYPTTEIIANGKTYTLNSGVAITVEDHIAEIIENAVALAPKVERYKSRFAQFIEGSITEVKPEDFEGITSIYGCAFYNLYVLKKATISRNITTIGVYAFFGCTGLKSIRFEENSKLKNIDSNAFEWCAKLTEFYLPETPPTLANVNAFANINAACTFYCKTQESLEAYKKAANWSTLTSTYSFVVENKNG